MRFMRRLSLPKALFHRRARPSPSRGCRRMRWSKSSASQRSTQRRSRKTKRGPQFPGGQSALVLSVRRDCRRRARCELRSPNPSRRDAKSRSESPGPELRASTFLNVSLQSLDVRPTQKQPIPPDLSLIHISEPTRQAEISYAVFCLKKKKKK